MVSLGNAMLLERAIADCGSVVSSAASRNRSLNGSAQHRDSWRCLRCWLRSLLSFSLERREIAATGDVKTTSDAKIRTFLVCASQKQRKQPVRTLRISMTLLEAVAELRMAVDDVRRLHNVADRASLDRAKKAEQAQQEAQDVQKQLELELALSKQPKLEPPSDLDECTVRAKFAEQQLEKVQQQYANLRLELETLRRKFAQQPSEQARLFRERQQALSEKLFEAQALRSEATRKRQTLALELEEARRDRDSYDAERRQRTEKREDRLLANELYEAVGQEIEQLEAQDRELEEEEARQTLAETQLLDQLEALNKELEVREQLRKREISTEDPIEVRKAAEALVGETRKEVQALELKYERERRRVQRAEELCDFAAVRRKDFCDKIRRAPLQGIGTYLYVLFREDLYVRWTFLGFKRYYRWAPANRTFEPITPSASFERSLDKAFDSLGQDFVAMSEAFRFC